MVKRILTIVFMALALAFSVVMVLLLMFWPKNLENYWQNLNYSESSGYVKNPDNGFYTPVFVKLDESGGTFTPPTLNDDISIYHLRIDISDIKQDIPNQSLRTLSSTLEYFFEKQKNVIVRFAYDSYFEGNIDNEPSIDTIISHIEKLSEVLNNFKPTITAIEAGMIGPWGEMHSSEIATTENINKVIDAWLENTDDISILVRTPKMIYDYLKIDYNNLENYEFVPNEKTKRLGLFNDAFLSTESDMGTYTNRSEEVDWISKNIVNTPYGGEVLSSSIGLNSFPNCLDEMDKLNLSYLNYEYDENVIQNWKDTTYENTTAFEYIRSHMGYRLVLTNSVFKYNEDFKQLEIDLTIENKGFSSYVREKDITVLFVTKDKEIIQKNCGTYNGERNLHLSIDDLPQKQDYEVYVSFSNIVDNKRYYDIRFANTELFNSTLYANLIGKITF